jgi:hypothetical protein
MQPGVGLCLAPIKQHSVQGLQGGRLLIDQNKQELVFHTAEHALRSAAVLGLRASAWADTVCRRPPETQGAAAETLSALRRSLLKKRVVCLSTGADSAYTE